MSTSLKSRKSLFIGLVIVFLIILRLGTSNVSWNIPIQSYSLIETVAAAIAFFAGILAVVRFRTKHNTIYLFVGIGLLLAGVLHGIQSFAVRTVLNNSIPLLDSSLLWWGINLSAVVLSISIFISWLIWWRDFREPQNGLLRTLVAITIATILLLLLPLSETLLIQIRTESLFAALFFIASVVGFLTKGKWRTEPFEYWLVISLLCFIGSQALFLRFSSELFDTRHFIAAFLTPVGYLCVLGGLLQNMMAIFKRAENTTLELTTANEALQREIADRQRFEIAEYEQRQLAEALHEIGLALSATLDFEDLLDRLLDQIARVMPYDTANVMLVNDEMIEIVCVRGYDQKIELPFTEPFPMTRMPSLQHMVDEQRPLIIEDTTVYPEWVNAEDSPHVRSWAGAPIHVRSKIVAFLALNTSKPNVYKQSDAARLTAFAGQAAIAIQNAQLYEQLQKRVDEQVTLNKISNAVTSTLELQKTLTIITDETTRLLEVDATSVVLLDEEQGDLVFAAASGVASEFVLGKRLALGQGILGWVAANGKPVLVSDAKRDERHFVDFDDESGFQANSILSVPLQTKGQTIGAIEAINKLTGPFNDDDLRLLTLLSGPLASAIENAQLYEKAQEEIANRTKAEAELEMERALLTRRVAERTADLSTANAELARAARMKDEFLASISHELRTPLNAILGISEALQEEVYGEMNEDQIQSLRSIEESGRHLLSLINDILDLSKMEAGKLDLEIRPVSIEAVCHASLRLIKQNAHKKRLKVHSTIDTSVNTIQADERRVKQILVNLLSNAVKFTLEGGEIGLEVTGDSKNKQVYLTVWDTGIGIAQEDISRLFRPFVQLDSRLSREYTGTGLGLSLVYKMVELHGGTVAVDSKLGEGTRFTVSLPWQEVGYFTDPMEEAELVAADAPKLLGLRRALLIEDSAPATAQIIRYLSELGIETITCPQGQGAWEKALVEQPDVIILDIILPDIPGWDVLKQLKAEPPTRDIPVLIVSVVDDPQKALEYGAASTLVKPINRQQFQGALRQILVDRIESKWAMIRAANQNQVQISHPLVLLAEDNEANLQTFSDYLLAKQFRLLVARNGIDAVKMTKEARPDIVLMDIQLPGMNGIEAIQEIRADMQLGSIPIVAVTALAMPEDHEACLKAGANAYISKPVRLKELVQLIELQLANRQTNQNGKEDKLAG